MSGLKLGERSGARARLACPVSKTPSAGVELGSSSAPPGRPKSCLRQPASGASSLPPSDHSAYTAASPRPPRHNRHNSLHRHASPNMKVVPTASKTRPAFARGSTQYHDPSRPVLRRAPTPFHYADERRPEEDDEEGEDVLHMEEKEFVDIDTVVQQLADFLNELSDMVGKQLMRKYVSADKIYALHQAPSMATVSGKVFGVPVQTACAVAPCLAFFAGQQQRLPVLVFTVIEEIYGRGLDVPGLFRVGGNEKRVEYLARSFGVEPFGEDVDIEQESIPDLCGLLQTWLAALPVPILEPVLERPFFSMVVCGEHAGLAPDERVGAARILLRLLPAPNLSLLVYLISFLSHFQRSTKLHVGVVAGLFAKPLAAKPIRGESENAKRARRDAVEDAKEVVKWLLTNWHLVMDGLMEQPILETNPFDVEEGKNEANRNFEEPPTVSNANTSSATACDCSSRKATFPPDATYVAGVAGMLDILSEHLAKMAVVLESALEASSDLRGPVNAAIEVVKEAKEANGRAAEDAVKAKTEVGETGKLKSRMEELEADKAKVEKKLLAAQKALTAALALEST